MGGLPAELIEQVKAVTGGFGVMALFVLWGLYRHLTQASRESRSRQDRVLKVLDDAREAQLKSMTDTAEGYRRRADEDYRRYAEDLSKVRGENQRLENEIDELREDRQEGWDRARGMEQIAHDYRHLANNRLAGSFEAGRLYATSRAGDETLRPQPMPEVPRLRDVPRRSPQDNRRFEEKP